MSSPTKPLIIAHRGASFDAPENTLAAFQLAWQQGADGIETDVRLTADGRVVCIHDEDTKRVGGNQHASRIVRDSRYADINSLDVGAWKGTKWRGETIPTLDDVLAVVPNNKLAFVELKTGPEIVGPLAEVLKRVSTAASQILIISFDLETLIACHRQLPHIRRHLLVEYHQQPDGTWTPDVNQMIANLRHTQADGLGSQNRPEHFNAAFVRSLKDAGCEQFQVWTVDDPAEARNYQQLGVWALTTNKPKLLHTILSTTSLL